MKFILLPALLLACPPLRAAAPPIHGPGAVEVNDSEDAPDLHGDFPQSCMVESETMRCSATIIAKNQAITAAHCAEGASSKEVTLTCGGNRAVYSGTLRPNKAYRYGAGITVANLENDYGFVTLKKKAVFNADPMPFASSSQWPLFSDPKKNDCRIAGWGVNNEGTDSRLFYAPVPNIVAAEESQRILLIGSGGSNENGNDHGDSGGTLMCRQGDIWYLVGVLTSAGKNNVGGAVSVMDFSY